MRRQNTVTITETQQEERALAHVRGLLAAVIEDDRLHPEPVLDVIAAFNELDLDGALPGLRRPEVSLEPFAALTLARDLCHDQLRELDASRCLGVGRAVGHIDRALEALSG
jgi:chorismate mutase